MGKIRVQRAADTKLKFADGLGKATMLPGVYPDVEVNKLVLKAGHQWQADLYAFEDRVQMLFFVTGTGYIGLPGRAFNITEPAVFVPFFDTDPFTVKAAPETDLEFVQFVCRQTDFDKTMMNTIVHASTILARSPKPKIIVTSGTSAMRGSELNAMM